LIRVWVEDLLERLELWNSKTMAKALVALALFSAVSASKFESKDRVFDYTHGDGCTSIIVGPNGAVGGGTMTSHTDDCFVRTLCGKILFEICLIAILFLVTLGL
jgi:hypothetical protein